MGSRRSARTLADEACSALWQLALADLALEGCGAGGVQDRRRRP